MTTDIIKSADAIEQFNHDKVELLKRTICKGATNDELELFVHACKRTGLDPFMKQIHAVKRWDKKANREVMSIQTGIDGYRLIADRTDRYAGNDDPVFEEGKTLPNKATVTVYKIVGGVRCPFSATARWSEYYPGDKQGYMWLKMPHVMLGKVAEALALRKAFPAELSGVYTREEMDQAGASIDEDAPPAAPPQRQQPAPADPLADNANFRKALNDIFVDTDFDQAGSENLIAAVLKKKRAATLDDLAVADRNALIAAIANGQLDNYRQIPAPSVG